MNRPADEEPPAGPGDWGEDPVSITTDRCRLTPVQASDLPDVVRLRADPAVRRHLGGPVREEIVRKQFVEMLARPQAGICWAVRTLKEDAFVGLVTLDDHHEGADTEVSFELMPEFWGLGYAAESVGAALAHARDTLGLPRVVAETQASNTRSRRLLERLGMRPERRLTRFGAEQVLYATE